VTTNIYNKAARRRQRNLQNPLNGKLKLKLKSRYDWRSVRPSWCRAHCATFDQILILSEICCLSLSLSVTVSSNCPSSLFVLFFFFILFFSPTLHVTCFMHIVQYMQGLVSPGSVQRSCCHFYRSSHYKSSLNTWTVVRLTATKFEPHLPYIADISISMILYDFSLLPA
jgi:hypothetical protein